MSRPSALKAARKRLGLSQAQMAKRLGVSQPTVCNIEKGKPPRSTRRWKWIAREYGVPMRTLLVHFTSEPPRSAEAPSP